MIGKPWLTPAAFLPILFCLGAASAVAQITNSGNCVAIIQGDWNTATVDCSEPLPVYPPEPHYNHVWQSPELGIGFEQDGKWLPLFTTPDGKKLIVDLAPKPFIVWIPDDHWTDPNNDLPALEISISWDAAEFDKPSSHLFQPATGMADSMRGSGWLFLTDANDDFPGHNYIVGHRFNRKMRDWRGFFVSMIGLPSYDRNLINSGEQGYAVFLMEEDDMPKFPGVSHRTVPIDEAPRDNIELNFGQTP
jgi:hypothetical protein